MNKIFRKYIKHIQNIYKTYTAKMAVFTVQPFGLTIKKDSIQRKIFCILS